ncbi:hypothetical protein GOBAR_AA39227 [Gossypium barbadense]|uniref:Uncharacterized protein n=1 Tax=Gossypium barbadense TaxID=3634 RepID=A0A2P5VRN1_GOSBA|nr:hypothetical protein GOBAR_AA39227 [Gossypium barbadense]
MGFGVAEMKVSAEASLGLSQIEQRPAVLGKQPSSLVELNVEGSMVGPYGMKASVENGVLNLDLEKGIYIGKGRGLGGKFDSSNSGKVLNRTLRGRGDKFKMYGNSRIPISEPMNSMVELIKSQVDDVDDKGVSARNGTCL